MTPGSVSPGIAHGVTRPRRDPSSLSLEGAETATTAEQKAREGQKASGPAPHVPTAEAAEAVWRLDEALSVAECEEVLAALKAVLAVRGWDHDQYGERSTTGERPTILPTKSLPRSGAGRKHGHWLAASDGWLAEGMAKARLSTLDGGLTLTLPQVSSLYQAAALATSPMYTKCTHPPPSIYRCRRAAHQAAALARSRLPTDPRALDLYGPSPLGGASPCISLILPDSPCIHLHPPAST